jgi:hypothetical protein
VRRLAPALAVAVGALNLAACDLAPGVTRLVSRQAQIDPPRLWLAEAVHPTGRVFGAVEVCADRALHEGFARADPEVNGQPCHAVSPIVSKPGLYAMRCEAVGQSFAVTVTSQGDLARDFKVRYALTPLESGRGPFVRTLRYRLLGSCPAGWRVGDEAPAANAPGSG